MKLRMMERAKLLWERLERDVGKMLFKTTGMLDIGTPAQLAPGIATYEACGVSFERLSREALAEKYPQLALCEGEEAVFQKDGWCVVLDVAVTVNSDRRNACKHDAT